MITFSDDDYVQTYRGLSTDVKPTTKVRNGAAFVELDTGNYYLFDEENSRWLVQTDYEEEVYDNSRRR